MIRNSDINDLHNTEMHRDIAVHRVILKFMYNVSFGSSRLILKVLEYSPQPFRKALLSSPVSNFLQYSSIEAGFSSSLGFWDGWGEILNSRLSTSLGHSDFLKSLGNST
jgi:hypothetical protein